MKIQMQKLPIYLYSLAWAVFVNAVFLLTGAIFIWLGTVSYHAASIFIIISVVVGSAIGSYLLARRNGSTFEGYLFAGGYFAAILLMSYVRSGSECMDSTLIKHIISIFSGTILGNLFGRRRYYKLRNFGKKRIRSTK